MLLIERNGFGGGASTVETCMRFKHPQGLKSTKNQTVVSFQQ